MFSYQHAYHAGNFADVFKHVVLVALLESLRAKDKPFLALDTHAGDGLYSLHDPRAARLGEYREGVARLWGVRGLHAAIDAWLAAVEAENPDGELRIYPGSPRLIARALRPGDRLLAVEGHPQAFAGLSRSLRGFAGARAERGDGWQALKSRLPPACGRGLVLIDPSYETQADTRAVVAALRLIHKRFRTGRVAVWYPLLAHKPLARWLDEIAALGIPRLMLAELSVDEPPARGLYGSGMLLLNPPWGLAEALAELLPALHARLGAPGKGGWRLCTLVDEQGRRVRE